MDDSPIKYTTKVRKLKNFPFREKGMWEWRRFMGEAYVESYAVGHGDNLREAYRDRCRRERIMAHLTNYLKCMPVSAVVRIGELTVRRAQQGYYCHCIEKTAMSLESTANMMSFRLKGDEWFEPIYMPAEHLKPYQQQH